MLYITLQIMMAVCFCITMPLVLTVVTPIFIDTVTIIADQSIVNDFKNSSIVDEPADLRDNFEREVEPVSAFLSRVEPLSQYHKQYELCRKLLLGLSDSKVGLYSLFHDNAVYRLGYNHPDTIRLAYM